MSLDLSKIIANIFSENLENVTVFLAVGKIF